MENSDIDSFDRKVLLETIQKLEDRVQILENGQMQSFDQSVDLDAERHIKTLYRLVYRVSRCVCKSTPSDLREDLKQVLKDSNVLDSFNNLSCGLKEHDNLSGFNPHNFHFKEDWN